MAMLVTPPSVDPWQWGWEAAAAIATVLAVVLAGIALVHESARARRAQEAEWARADRLRAQEQLAAGRRARARAARIAKAIDQELFSYGGSLVTSEFHLSDAKLAADANGAMARVLRDLEAEDLAILRSFIGDLDDFPPEVGSALASVLGTLNAIRAARALTPIQGDRDAAVAFARAFRDSISASTELVRLARTLLGPLIGRHPVQDFGTVAELRNREAEFLRTRR